MSDSTKQFNYGPVAILGLAMALGPLTALSLGTRYAGEETWERANAGLENYTPVSRLAPYGATGATAGIPEYARDKTLVDVLNGSGVFGTFKAAVAETGLVESLNSNDNYTLFVPSDEAFAKLPAGQREALLSDKAALEAMLSKHIVPGRYTATDLMEMRQALTLDGSSVAVGPSAQYNGHVGIGGAEIVKTNLFASNGIVHVVDSVIR
ncbi:MAG: fasciclin domain-containing protein [Thiohalocapsa sp.]